MPDLIQSMPSMAQRSPWEIAQEERKESGRNLEVLPSGDTRVLDWDDNRLRLRVIDIKLASEPGAHYFAEVVYYSITLAAWILEKGYGNDFVVVAAPAVWPGSYKDSMIAQTQTAISKLLREPTTQEVIEALEGDIEVAPFDVFAPLLKRFFLTDLPHVLHTPWQELDWFVNYKCNGCEFLGFPWLGKSSGEKNHCWPMAERDGRHLSQVVGLTRGTAKVLNVFAPNVLTLAQTPTSHHVFDRSTALKTRRNILPARARALRDGGAALIPGSGGDALMPKWPNLRIFIFLEYDLSSAITVSLGLRAYWKEPLPYDETRSSPLKPKNADWTTPRGRSVVGEEASDAGDTSQGNPEVARGTNGTIHHKHQEVFLVDDRRLSREAEELVKFLTALFTILQTVAKADDDDIAEGRRQEGTKPVRSTYQIFLWDEAQRKHLVRIIGRHLAVILADEKLHDLAWLFPPPELLGHPDEASYRSPFTLVSNVVQNTVAADIPHHYTLLEIARLYKPEHLSVVEVHPLYQEPLSDLMPGERIYEFWNKSKGDNVEKMLLLRELCQKKLTALGQVTGRLWRDLQHRLIKAAAPPVIRPKRTASGMSPQGMLWYEFSRLNYALGELEEHAIRSMPSDEREARYKSAYLLQRLSGEDRESALDHLLRGAEEPWKNQDEIIIYTLGPESTQFNVRPPALGFSLAPRSDPNFLDAPAYPLIKGTDWKGNSTGSVAAAGITQVSVIGLDRAAGLIALRPWWAYYVPELERLGLVNLSADVMLDPTGEDFLSKKIKLTVERIGHPLSATQNDAITLALGTRLQANNNPTSESPASTFLWGANLLAKSYVDRNVEFARSALLNEGVSLNASQWAAWNSSLTCRLTLIWGPPGTGKSQTVRALIAGAVLEAQNAGRCLRILMTSQTYNAVDNILFDTESILRKLLPNKPYRLFRLQSDYSMPPSRLQEYPGIEQLAPKSSRAPDAITELQKLLQNREGIVIVGAPSQQIHNLAISTKNKNPHKPSVQMQNTQKPWFDLVIIDEASQLDTAESTLIVSKAAEGASFVLAGDDLQLPPIHLATPPENLDDIVGSVYGYVRHQQNVVPMPLQINYRSSAKLVEFTRRAGYDQGLTARHTDLRLKLVSPIPVEQPEHWPSSLFWTPNWARLLDPELPAVSFVYVDDLVSQVNDFEADAVASLLFLLHGRLDSQLAGEYDKAGNLKLTTGQSYDDKSFWKHAVGVVTPHKAQMARVVSRLHAIFPTHDPSLISQAVDTVERFQGQQRDIIIASFGLGDPDMIEAEDEFLYSLNRFNVTTSRARAKVIVLITRSLVDHVSNDANVIEQSRLLKYFVDTFCSNFEAMTLGYYDAENKFHARSGQARAAVR